MMGVACSYEWPADTGATQRLPPMELVRLTNAAARLFDVYQSGA